MTVENEILEAVAVAPAHLCRPERSPEEKAARDARRALGFDNAARLLGAAEAKALEGEVGVADALTKIAQTWDSVAY